MTVARTGTRRGSTSRSVVAAPERGCGRGHGTASRCLVKGLGAATAGSVHDAVANGAGSRMRRGEVVAAVLLLLGVATRKRTVVRPWLDLARTTRGRRGTSTTSWLRECWEPEALRSFGALALSTRCRQRSTSWLLRHRVGAGVSRRGRGEVEVVVAAPCHGFGLGSAGQQGEAGGVGGGLRRRGRGCGGRRGSDVGTGEMTRMAAPMGNRARVAATPVL